MISLWGRRVGEDRDLRLGVPCCVYDLCANGVVVGVGRYAEDFESVGIPRVRGFDYLPFTTWLGGVHGRCGGEF